MLKDLVTKNRSYRRFYQDFPIKMELPRKPKVVIETIGDDGDIKYWRDSEMVHHLPKHSLEEIILN